MNVQHQSTILSSLKGAPMTILVAMLWAMNDGEPSLQQKEIAARTHYDIKTVRPTLALMQVQGLVTHIGDGFWQLTKGGHQLILGEAVEERISDDQLVLLPLPPKGRNFLPIPLSLNNIAIDSLKREGNAREKFSPSPKRLVREKNLTQSSMTEPTKAMLTAYVTLLRETVGIPTYNPEADDSEFAAAETLADHFTPAQVAECYWHYKTDLKDTFWHSKHLKLKHLVKLVPEYIAAQKRKENNHAAHIPSRHTDDEESIQRDLQAVQARNARRSELPAL